MHRNINFSPRPLSSLRHRRSTNKVSIRDLKTLITIKERFAGTPRLNWEWENIADYSMLSAANHEASTNLYSMVLYRGYAAFSLKVISVDFRTQLLILVVR